MLSGAEGRFMTLSRRWRGVGNFPRARKPTWCRSRLRRAQRGPLIRTSHRSLWHEPPTSPPSWHGRFRGAGQRSCPRLWPHSDAQVPKPSPRSPNIAGRAARPRRVVALGTYITLRNGMLLRGRDSARSCVSMWEAAETFYNIEVTPCLEARCHGTHSAKIFSGTLHIGR